MAWPTIVKTTTAPVAPTLVDYERSCAEFSWAAARRELGGLPGGRGLNIAHEAIDRHAAGPRSSHLALRWLGMDVLNFVIGLHHELGVDIPESDYPKLATLEGCIEHLASLADIPPNKETVR